MVDLIEIYKVIREYDKIKWIKSPLFWKYIEQKTFNGLEAFD